MKFLNQIDGAKDLVQDSNNRLVTDAEKTAWNSKSDTDTVTTVNGKTGAIAKADIVALGIPAQDTVYTHPANHPASVITQDASNRFVTDAEKTAWNAKGTSNLALGTTSSTAYRGDYGNTAYTHSQSAHAPSGAQVNQTLTSGNGMAAWTATNGNLTIPLGTPSTLTTATTNAVTTTSHTHSVTFPVTSVAGKTGAVTLGPTDVGAAAATHAHGTYDRATSALTGANVFSDIVVVDGIVTGTTTRALTAANVGAAATSHGNHVPTTGTANNAIFLRNDNTWQTVTPANIGAATAAHTHTTWDRASSALTGANVFSDIVVTDGITTAISTRALTLANLGYTGATNANYYTHPSGDGNLHVPATSTTNSGKVLKAGSTAGSLSWADLPTGKKVARFVVGTSTAGWTAVDCDYLCDGTDDETEINAAIIALPTTGGEVVILDGTYNITVQINVTKDNVSIRGNGNATILKRMSNSSSGEGVITLVSRSGCKISNLQVDGNDKVGFGIRLYSSSNNTVTGNICTSNQYSGISLLYSSNNTITGNTFNNNNENGIYLYNSSNNNTITSNTSNNNDSGIYLYGSSNNIVTGNISNNNSSGISSSDSSNSTVTSNICNDNYFGINLNSSSNNVVTGNTCNNNNSGIRLNNSSDNAVTGNTCIRGTGLVTDYDSNWGQYTIYLYGTGNNYNLISNNNCMGKAPFIEGGTGNTVIDNKWSNSSGRILENYTEKLTTVIASGGSIDLSLGNVFVHTPSGNRTYSITNAISGQAHSFTLIVNMGSTVRTLTFPSSVKWQGGEIPDLTTANKTYVLTFMSVDGGTNWLGMFGGEF